MNKKMVEVGSEGSPIRNAHNAALAEEEQLDTGRVYDLTLGNPSIPCPVEVTEALKKLINEVDPIELHSYTHWCGDLRARHAVAQYLNDTYQAGVSMEYVYMSVGAAASITISLHALVEEGEEVLVFTPYFSEYVPWVEKAGAVFKEVPTNKDFLPDEKLLRERITKNTRVLLMNSPNNPTGAFYDEEVIKMISKVLLEKSKEYGQPIYLLSDEPYRELLYDGEEYPFITRFYPYSVVCYSFSKSLSLPGERVGYIVIGDNNPEKEELFKAITGAGRALGFICVNSLFQKMLPLVISKTSDLSIYKKNRDFLVENLRRIGYQIVEPKGAFYIFLKALEEDAAKFAYRARDYHLYLVPSDHFGVKGYVRLAYCLDEDTIHQSISAFEELYESYQ
ncbi:MAG: pyridoxal phosphate-dependent aminotransferase [Bacilli bacterium]|nr:pyridoxal phosphate-dependent aminotransferase [Bacilli bacterium]